MIAPGGGCNARGTPPADRAEPGQCGVYLRAVAVVPPAHDRIAEDFVGPLEQGERLRGSGVGALVRMQLHSPAVIRLQTVAAERSESGPAKQPTPFRHVNACSLAARQGTPQQIKNGQATSASGTSTNKLLRSCRAAPDAFCSEVNGRVHIRSRCCWQGSLYGGQPPPPQWCRRRQRKSLV